jgi:hypothetical protein
MKENNPYSRFKKGECCCCGKNTELERWHGSYVCSKCYSAIKDSY